MLTAILLITVACNVYLLIHLRRAASILGASHASLLAVVSQLQERKSVVEQVVTGPCTITGTLSKALAYDGYLYPRNH
ncbi:hypothetical protein ACK33C_22465 [Aeromonas hydrophila]|uniref:hypothetical protein n=1 Tax=Aeromonas hydrophila TaxID=644 RepID=UPI003986F7CA